MAVPGWILFFILPQNAWFHACAPFLLIVLCAAAFCSRWFRWFYANRVIAITGGMCYSIYLLHFILLASVFKFTRGIVFTNDYLLTLAVQLVVTGRK